MSLILPAPSMPLEFTSSSPTIKPSWLGTPTHAYVPVSAISAPTVYSCANAGAPTHAASSIAVSGSHPGNDRFIAWSSCPMFGSQHSLSWQRRSEIVLNDARLALQLSRAAMEHDLPPFHDVTLMRDV